MTRFTLQFLRFLRSMPGCCRALGLSGELRSCAPQQPRGCIEWQAHGAAQVGACEGQATTSSDVRLPEAVSVNHVCHTVDVMTSLWQQSAAPRRGRSVMGLPPYIPCPTPDPLGTNMLDVYHTMLPGIRMTAPSAAKHGCCCCPVAEGECWFSTLSRSLSTTPLLLGVHVRHDLGAFAASTCNVGAPFGLLGGLLTADRIRFCIGTNQLLHRQRVSVRHATCTQQL